MNRRRRWLRLSGFLALLAACLLALDHRWTQLTPAGLSLMVGAFLARRVGF